MESEKNNHINYIVVSATALDKSGALTILKQFLERAADDKHDYLCFVPEGVALGASDNIKLINIDKQSWVTRILWDAFLLKRWLISNKINYHKLISLQNTSVNIDVDQIIYLHQALPFSPVKWNFFDRDQFKPFLYKHFYSFFIFRYVSDTTLFVVQTTWVKNSLCKKFGVEGDKIKVIQPDLILAKDDGYNINLDSHSDVFNILYPASPLFYKNHLILLHALHLLGKRRNISLVRLNVTFKPEDYVRFHQLVLKLNLEVNITYLGILPYDELILKYRNSDLVAFPSYIETFGLPLAEAAFLGKDIICSDTEFAREVLNDYQGAEYLDFNNAESWADSLEKKIDNIGDTTNIKAPFKYKQSSTWADFFDLLNR